MKETSSAATTGSPMMQQFAPRVQELDDETLLQFSQIVSAFSLDLRDELKRRGPRV